MNGLQIYNASGVLMLDGTTRTGRIKGMARIKGTNGSVACDMSDGTPFWSFQPDFFYKHISNQTPPPIITIDSNGVYWSYSSVAGLAYAVPITGFIIYGVY